MKSVLSRALVFALAVVCGAVTTPVQAQAVAVDLNGDGFVDRVEREVRIGPDVAGFSRVVIRSAADESVVWEAIATESNDLFGWNVTSADDIDGDGLPDLVVGAPWAYVGESVPDASGRTSGRFGRVRLIGSRDGTMWIADAIGPGTFGLGLRVIEDRDGDGFRDVLVRHALEPEGYDPLTSDELTWQTSVDSWALYSGFDGTLLGEAREALNSTSGTILTGLCQASDADDCWGPQELAGTLIVEGAINGDVTGDGTVDLSDVNRWLIGASADPNVEQRERVPPGDANAQGTVDTQDLVVISENFGANSTSRVSDDAAALLALMDAVREAGATARGVSRPIRLQCAPWLPCGSGPIVEIPCFEPPCNTVGPCEGPCCLLCCGGCCNVSYDSYCPHPCGDSDGDGTVNSQDCDSPCHPPVPGSCCGEPATPECMRPCDDSDGDGMVSSGDCDSPCYNGPRGPCDSGCDDDGDGTPNSQDCDLHPSRCGTTTSGPACECGDSDGDGTPNGSDCDSGCSTPGQGGCSCEATFTPDPSTHAPGDPEMVTLLPGDIEQVFLTFDVGESAGITIKPSDLGIIQISRDRVQWWDELPVPQGQRLDYLYVRSLSNGTVALQLFAGNVEPGETPCEQISVSVGGSIQIEYDRSPTFAVYPNLGRQADPDQPPIIDDPDILEPRGPIPAELIEYINQNVDIRKGRMRITLRDANGGPKRGKAVLPFSRDSILSFEFDQGPALTTDDRGRVELNLSAEAPVGTSQEQGLISDQLGIIVGEAAERYPAPPYTASLIEQVFTNQLIESRRFTGHTLETPRFPFTQESGDTGFVTGASMRVVIINHAHTIILESWLKTAEVSNWQGNIGLLVTVEAEDGSTFQFAMTEGPELFDAGDQFKLRAIQSLEAHAPNGLSFEPRAPNPADPPPGNASESITVEGVASFAGEIAWGFVPFGPDVLDLGKELIWNPLVNGEDPNYLIAALSGVGILADAGYLTGVAGVAGNAAVAVVKQIAKRVPDPVLREMLDQAGSIPEVAQALVTYVSRVPAPPGASVVSSIQNAVSQSAAQVHRLVGSALAIPADKVAAALLMLSNRSGKWFSHDGAEGLAYLLKHERRQAAEALFDEFSDEVVDSTLDVLRFADIPTGSLSDEAIRGAAVAVDTISPGRADSLVEFFRGTQIIGGS